MDKTPVGNFAQEFLARSLSSSHQQKRYSLGTHSFQLSLDSTTYLGDLIAGAFLPDDGEVVPEFTLSVWQGELPDLDWARNLLNQDVLVPEHQSPGYRIAFDKSQGIVLVFDIAKKSGAIWLAPTDSLNFASFITPFRIMMSWFALTFGGEIVHASAVEIGGKGILLNGPSGSGKSTLALLALQAGASLMCDDVALIEDGMIYAVYSRGKVLRSENLLDTSGLETFELPDGGVGKTIVPLTQFGPFFAYKSPLSAIILPIIAYVGGHEEISSGLAFSLMAPNSLREILGGTPKNYLQLKKVVNSVPTIRLALSGDYSRDRNALLAIAESLS